MKRPVSQVKPTDQNYKSYLVWKDEKTMLFRKPPAARRMETLLFVGLTVQLVIGPLVGAVLTGKLILAAVSALGAGWILFVLRYVVSPDNICLDGEQRTYEWTIGLPWKPVRVTGSFADIKGVCISPGKRVMLLMVKRKGLRKSVVVSDPAMSSIGSNAWVVSRSCIAASRTLAEELSRMYGFPIVPHPNT